MQDPILTVVVPSYNVEAYLEKGLSTFSDARFDGRLEVLVVDDGSKDATPQIAQRFVDERPWIFRLIRKENGGHGSVINVGMSEARGRYFRIVDGDDWVNADALAQLLDVLASTDADLVIDERVEVDMQTGKETYRELDVAVECGVVFSFDKLCLDPQVSDSIFIHMVNVRTSLLRDNHIRLLEGVFYEDYEFVCKVAAYASSIRFERLPVYHYLVGNAAQSISDANYARRWDDHICVLDEVLRFYAHDAQELPAAKREYLARRIVLLINTLYNIALIFDSDRGRGAERAKELRRRLRADYPQFAQATKRRYAIAKSFHIMGVDSQKKLDKLKGR